MLSHCELEQVVQPTPIRRLWSLPCGSVHLRTRLFEHSTLLGETFDRLAHGYQPMVCDLPAVDLASGMLEAACQLDGVVLVVEADRTPQELVANAQRLLVRSGARLLGVVLNRQRSTR
jgi:Mrp family chromosome partitioning ATPase